MATATADASRYTLDIREIWRMRAGHKEEDVPKRQPASGGEEVPMAARNSLQKYP
jgi:hypothetical protein